MPIGSGLEVSVEFYAELDAVVSQLLAHVSYGRTVGQQQGSERVPKIVKPPAMQSSLWETPVEMAISEVGGVEPTTIFIRKQPFLLGMLPTAEPGFFLLLDVFLEHRAELVREIYSAWSSPDCIV